MTEKRFIFDPSISHFDDKVTGKTYCEYNLEKVVDLLNSLSDENEQLKQKNEKWKEKYFTMGEMFSKQVDNIDEVNNILVDADTMNKEQLIRKIDKVINND